jgi:hypothetical protein
MGWTVAADAITGLRALINDGPTDKRALNKKVLGVADGVNVIFTTFENRRVGDFLSPAFPLGLYLSGIPLTGAQVVQDDPESGVFQLSPGVYTANRQSLTASYYYQWFKDEELSEFLTEACRWLGQGDNFVGLDPGLNAAVLRYAAQCAYEKAAMRYSVRMSETYQLEDAPSEDILNSIKAFKDMAEGFMDKAKEMRDDFYTRQGQSLAPNFSFALGRVRDPQPRR